MAVENFSGKKRGRPDDLRSNEDRSTKKAHVEPPSNRAGTPTPFHESNYGTPYMPLPITPGEDFYRHPPLTPLTPTPLLAQQGPLSL